jgi:tetratricopeptide (TPR) repeat protein
MDAEIDRHNQDVYEDLLVSIEASPDRFSLLIAVCDDATLREQIIQRYEAELSPHFQTYRVVLARGEPSLRRAIAEMIQANSELQHPHPPAIVTVTGAEKMYFFKLGETRSEQDIFFGYLQWTREALREFGFPIVLWVNHAILNQLSYRAPDFWSWRKGVFRFTSQPTEIAPRARIASIEPESQQESRLFPLAHDLTIPDSNGDGSALSVDDLKLLIQQLESQDNNNKLLSSLYIRLGQAYIDRLQHGSAENYQLEHEQAIQAFSNAANLQRELHQEHELADTLSTIADLYYKQARYQEAEARYLQALKLKKRLLGDTHPEVASSMAELASLYDSQGEFQKAEYLYLQALELSQRSPVEDNPDTIAYLNNLAFFYKSQGRYAEAEALYLQALDLIQQLLGEEHPYVTTSLNNLAMLYRAQGRYEEAEALYEQAIAISTQIYGITDLNTLLLETNLESLRTEWNAKEES